MPLIQPFDYKQQRDQIIVEQDPLSIELDDETLRFNIEQRQDLYDEYIENHDIANRRQKLRNYYLGIQLNEAELKPYQAKYIDNAIYEAEGAIKPIALSRLPDLLAKPGSPNDQSKQTAKDITGIINSDIRKRKNRRILGIAHKRLPLDFGACVKIFWDRELGDYTFKNVPMENIIFDPYCSTNEVSEMEFFGEWQEMSIKTAVMMFPDKENELYKELYFNDGDENDEDKMATRIRILEIWFKWPNNARNPETKKQEYQMISGVAWKYKTLILGKMKNPYWDWEGIPRFYTLDVNKNKIAVPEKKMDEIFMTQQNPVSMGIQGEKVFYNHLDQPTFPYFLAGYDQMGEGPLDVTSRIEQVLSQQDTINKRGRQITEMNDRAKGKHVFNSRGISKKDVANMDMDNPNQDIVTDGNVNEMHAYIKGEPAPPQVFKEQENEREKIFQKMGTNSTTRGVREDNETLGGRQLLREADYGKIDDLVEETINAMAEWQADWILQMIKLFYTEDKMKTLLGKDGQVDFKRINQNMIEDGMEVVMSASGVDKMQRKREAYEKAKMKLIHPLAFYIDTDTPDPKGEAEKLITFMLSPELYLKTFVQNQTVQQMAQGLNGPGGPQGLPQQTQLPPPQQTAQPGVPLGAQVAPPVPSGGGGQIPFYQSHEWWKGYGGEG